MIIPTISRESELWKEGFTHVAGVDEVGRGPLAGPVMAGAVIIHKENQVVSLVRDSKLMSRKQREEVFDLICKKSSAYGIGRIESEEIDKIGIHVATKKAMLDALMEAEKNLGEKIDYVLVDGSKTLSLTGYQHERIKKGGLYHYSISAASILAKVLRDNLMGDLAKLYPQYKFEKHVGYGTNEHMMLLKKFGPCPIHRMSFAPVSQMNQLG